MNRPETVSTESLLSFDPDHPETVAQYLVTKIERDIANIREIESVAPDLSYLPVLMRRIPRYQARIVVLLDFIDRGEPAGEWPLVADGLGGNRFDLGITREEYAAGQAESTSRRANNA